VLVEDDTGDVSLVFFKMPRARIQQLLPVGTTRYISGKLEQWDGRRQMVHPTDPRRAPRAAPPVEAVYGQTEG
jgi:ATP-dependent DNA helicase RecG